MDSVKFCIFCLFSLLFSLFTFGISYEPDKYLVNETHLLEQDETLENVLTIKHNEEEYYVVQITYKGKTNSYIALKKFEKKIVENEVLNKQLFQTAEFYIEYQEFKSKVRDNPALIWFIVKWGEVSTISNKIANEGLELDLIRSTLESSSGNEIISQMESMLEAIKTTLDVLKNKMSSTDTKEGSFLTSPTAGEEKELKDAIIECYSYLESLHLLNQDYESLQQQLAIAIADDPDLDRETKQQLNKTADLPEEFTEIEKWYNSAQNMQLKKTMENIYFNSSSASSNYAKKIGTRLKRNYTFNVLYGEDPDLKKKTDNKYSSLKEAFDVMQGEELRDLWVEQEKLSEFFQEWKRAEAKFNLGDYDRALEAAGKAKKNAIAVYSAGLIEIDGKQIDYSTLITGVVLIIILITILYIIRNRGKLKSFISGSEEEERVVFNEWE